MKSFKHGRNDRHSKQIGLLSDLFRRSQVTLQNRNNETYRNSVAEKPSGQKVIK